MADDNSIPLPNISIADKVISRVESPQKKFQPVLPLKANKYSYLNQQVGVEFIPRGLRDLLLTELNQICLGYYDEFVLELSLIHISEPTRPY